MEKDFNVSHKKKNKKIEGVIKKWLLALIDITLFAFSNATICYIVSGGKIGSSLYSPSSDYNNCVCFYRQLSAQTL